MSHFTRTKWTEIIRNIFSKMILEENVVAKEEKNPADTTIVLQN
jgi:hypothetical protein